MRNLEELSNDVTIIGTLMDMTFRNGRTTGANPYEYVAATALIRVAQTYGHGADRKQELSEIPVNFWAKRTTNAGTTNPMYENICKYAEYPTVKNVGLERAARVSVGGASLCEDFNINFRTGEYTRSTWVIRASFLNIVNVATVNAATEDCATFSMIGNIARMCNEMNEAGEETGRAIMDVVVMAYGKRGDILTLYAEDPTVIEHFERGFEVGNTCQVMGRIRNTSIAVTPEPEVHSSWGEATPVSKPTSVKKNELILTFGSEEPFDDEFAYDMDDIRAVLADRQTRRDQAVQKAGERIRARKNKNTSTYGNTSSFGGGFTAAAAPSANAAPATKATGWGSNYSWEG